MLAIAAIPATNGEEFPRPKQFLEWPSNNTFASAESWAETVSTRAGR
jgi:hypothetical protein